MRIRGMVVGAVATALVAVGLVSGATDGSAQAASSSASAACQQSGKGSALSSSRTFARSRVWIFGDSITHQNRFALYRSTPAAADTVWGRATAPTVQALGRQVHATRYRPRVVVMAVGTNDVSAPDAVTAQVRLARAVLPTSVRLLWVNVYVDTLPDHGAAVNAAIASVPGVQVVDWAGVNAAWAGDGPSPLLSDGIHLSCIGQAVWTSMIHRAVTRG